MSQPMLIMLTVSEIVVLVAVLALFSFSSQAGCVRSRTCSAM
ncbi:MAG: hypothetical protein ACRDYA_03700 [Egibacteraceae bacterium]